MFPSLYLFLFSVWTSVTVGVPLQLTSDLSVMWLPQDQILGLASAVVCLNIEVRPREDGSWCICVSVVAAPPAAANQTDANVESVKQQQWLSESTVTTHTVSSGWSETKMAEGVGGTCPHLCMVITDKWVVCLWHMNHLVKTSFWWTSSTLTLAESC